MTERTFLKTLFEISSGSDTLSSADQPIASRIYCIVTWGSYRTSFEYTAKGMSVKFVVKVQGRMSSQNTATFCSFDAAWLSRVGINFDIMVTVMYFLTYYMVFLSALFT